MPQLKSVRADTAGATSSSGTYARRIGLVLRDDDGGRRHHRLRHIPQSGARGRAGSNCRAHPGGVGAGRRHRAAGRAGLRRAGRATAGGRRGVRLSARCLRTAAGISLRLDAPAGDRHRRHRRRGGDVRELYRRPDRTGTGCATAARRWRDPAAVGGQLCGRQAGRDHPECAHGSEAGCAGDSDRGRAHARSGSAPHRTAARRWPAAGSCSPWAPPWSRCSLPSAAGSRRTSWPRS